MKTFVNYQCETCGNVYSTEQAAVLCETTLMAVPLFDVGDILPVNTRYRGVEHHRVLERKLVASFMAAHLQDASDADAVGDFLSRVDDPTFHEWCYRVAEQVQLGKEWWDDWIPESSCEVHS